MRAREQRRSRCRRRPPATETEAYLEYVHRAETTEQATAALTIAEWEPPTGAGPVTPALRD